MGDIHNMALALGGIGVGQAVQLCWEQTRRGSPWPSGHLQHKQGGHVLLPLNTGGQHLLTTTTTTLGQHCAAQSCSLSQCEKKVPQLSEMESRKGNRIWLWG